MNKTRVNILLARSVHKALPVEIIATELKDHDHQGGPGGVKCKQTTKWFGGVVQGYKRAIGMPRRRRVGIGPLTQKQYLFDVEITATPRAVP